MELFSETMKLWMYAWLAATHTEYQTLCVYDCSLFSMAFDFILGYKKSPHSSRDLKAQAGYWFQQPAKNKKRVKTGTDILKKSLDSTQYDTSE